MARQELHSSNIKIEQKPPISIEDLPDRIPDIVDASEDELWNKDRNDKLAFFEEPVTIRLEFGTQENPARFYQLWCNGKPCEVLINNQWIEYRHGVPVGEPITIKRKYLGIIISNKIDSITTEVLDRNSERPQNEVRRRTSQVHSFSVIHDPNPAGPAWVANEIRRNL